LRAAIAEALERSPALAASDDAVASAEIRRGLAASRFSPTIVPMVDTERAPAGADRQVLGISMSQLLVTGAVLQSSVTMSRYGSGPSAVRDAGFTVGVSQPLFRGFGVTTRAELDMAKGAVALANAAAADGRAHLVLRVAEAYFALVRAQRLDAEARLALDRAGTFAEMSEARVGVGLATRLDVYRAGLLKAQAESAALHGRDGLDRAREDLNLLIGRRAETPLVVEDHIMTVVNALKRPDQTSLDAPPATLELIEARARLDHARQAESSARWHEWPGVTLDLTYTRNGLGVAAGTSPLATLNGWRVGLSTTHALGRGVQSASTAQASLDLRAAERAVEAAEQRALVAAERAVRGVARATDAVAVQQRAVSLAGEQRDLALMRYSRGLADALEVIDAERQLFQAQSGLIGVECDLALALFTEQRAAGTLDPDRVIP
jgi:outer membrane protein